MANHMPPMSSIAWGRSWGVASTVVEREKSKKKILENSSNDGAMLESRRENL